MRTEAEILEKIKTFESELNPFNEVGDLLFEDWDIQKEKELKLIQEKKIEILKWVLGKVELLD